MATAAIASFRLGGQDGVSIVASSWQRQLTELGFTVRTVAGSGAADRVLPGLALDAAAPVGSAELTDALRGVDLVVAENILTIPLNVPVSLAVAEVLRGRPVIVHHHDPPWQRARFAHVTALPLDDPAWRHVTINQMTERQFRRRGIAATTIPNAFDTEAPPGDREAMRDRLGVGPGERLALHPVRAIARKDVPAALRLATAVGAAYWLAGPAEEDYASTVERLLADARVRVLRDGFTSIPDAYAAADAVLFPSLWEGFGLPPLEAAVHRRLVAVGRYPVAEELRSLGFRWLPTADPAPLAAALDDPASVKADLDVNHELVRAHFSLPALRDALRALLTDAGWLP
jgi:glycosyltransferase involved in cell wall biosynthesis